VSEIPGPSGHVSTEHPLKDADALAAAVHRVHNEYLFAIIEAENICPFARRSRELDRVARDLVIGESTPWLLETASNRVFERVHEAKVWEIILITFPVFRDDHIFGDPTQFESFHNQFRQRLEALGCAQTYYSVCFHPDQGKHSPPATQPAGFVATLRRSPDPVIQCVHVETLEDVRKAAQASAQAKMIAQLQADAARLPAEFVNLMKHAVLTDSELSSEIARRNYERHAHAAGREALERGFARIAALRERLYAPWLAHSEQNPGDASLARSADT
jgi:hypothetical protein